MIELVPSRIGRAGGMMRRAGVLRAHLVRTTPGRLRAASAAVVLAAVCSWAVAAAAAGHRRDAVRTAAGSEALLVSAQLLSAKLSDADATVARAFVVGGLESVASLQRYDGDLRAAATQLSIMARDAPAGSAIEAELRRIGLRLPVYAGLVATARANFRQGFPVGGAYLRAASRLMREEILKSAVALYAIQARSLNDAYRGGTSLTPLVAAMAVSACLVVLLAVAQAYLSWAFRRTFNVGLLLATAAALVGLVWLMVAFSGQREALVDAQREGSDSVQVLSTIRILALRAQADESLALIARGGGRQALGDFDASVARIGHGDPKDLFGAARTVARRDETITLVDGLRRRYEQYLAVHGAVVERQDAGNFEAAVKLAVSPGVGSEVALADAFAQALEERIASGQRRFDRSASAAAAALGGLAPGIVLLHLACVGLALLGLRARIGEYR